MRKDGKEKEEEEVVKEGRITKNYKGVYYVPVNLRSFFAYLFDSTALL